MSYVKLYYDSKQSLRFRLNVCSDFRKCQPMRLRYFHAYSLYDESYVTNKLLLDRHIHMSHDMKKAVSAICEQQRRRSDCASDCASAKSGQRLCCSLPA